MLFQIKPANEKVHPACAPKAEVGMSTPRRSSRLRAKDQENQQKLELLRCERRRKGRKTEFLSSDSDEAEVDGTSSECDSSSGRERPVVNVERTPKVNNFIRV